MNFVLKSFLKTKDTKYVGTRKDNIKGYKPKRFSKKPKKWVFRLIALKGINRYTFATFNFLMEMHVWVTGNGVASAEKRYESSSFN